MVNSCLQVTILLTYHTVIVKASGFQEPLLALLTTKPPKPPSIEPPLHPLKNFIADVYCMTHTNELHTW